MNRLPPLKALPAFDAAVRKRSFSLAAAELSVTPGAIGQQVQKLEDWLGVALFRRGVRQVTPTADGLAYWRQIQPALTQLADASQRLRAQRSRSVALSMPPAFAAKWFPPRMSGFLTRHPDIELHLSASATLVDFERDPIDLAVRYFDGRDPDLIADLMFRDEARLYCAPAYARRKRLRRPADLVRTTLLETQVLALWREWLSRHAGLADGEIAAIPKVHFDQATVAIEAAKQGQGVVISSPVLVGDELAAGTLVRPFDEALPVPHGYFVVHHRALSLRPPARALRDWLLEAAMSMRSA